ncbi:MAG: hypothetical protein P9L93_01005 [Candidatus Gorgyraea atricola]|nr:hypothetical protein [Candidatus Gorgyraea atricola]
MTFLIVSGTIALIFGILLLVSPDGVRKMNMKVSRMMSNIDNFVCQYNQGIGLCLVCSGLTILFIAYYLYKTGAHV